MSSGRLFSLGRREVSPAAAAAISAVGIDADLLFARHEAGDWGSAPDWVQGDNGKSVCAEGKSVPIRSHYLFDDECEVVLITATDRTRSRLLHASEFAPRQLGVYDGYALWADSYDAPNPLIRVEEPAVEALLNTLPYIGSGIDVATGTGRLARKLGNRGVSDVLGVDGTPEMLAIARETARREGMHQLRFESGYLGELPVAANAFDLLTCGLALCHVADIRGAILDFVRVVRPGGWILLTDLHPATSAFGWRTDFVTPDGFFQLPNEVHTRDEYLDALTDSGCRLLTVHDLALDGTPYGDVSESAVRAKGLPPFCLVILAQKPG